MTQRAALLFALLLSACRTELLGSVESTAPPACASLTTLAACEARSDCAAGTCPICNGTSFAGCTVLGAKPPGCPPIAPCPRRPTSCADLGESACEARSDCHAIYASPPDPCPDAPCGAFLRCGDGHAHCTGLSCALQPLDCPPGYFVGYAAGPGCEEGCVKASACDPPAQDCRLTGCTTPDAACLQCTSTRWECLVECG